MPGIGATRTRNHSSHGSEIEMSMMVRQMLSFTYNYRRFFWTASASFDGNIFMSDNLSFASGIVNTKVVVGIRF